MHWVKRDPQERVYLPLSPSYRLSHLLLKIIVVSDSWAEAVWLDVGARGNLATTSVTSVRN
jgi:hypothetical protein